MAAAMIDLSGFGYFVPLFIFLLVFVLCYAFIAKAKIINNAFANISIAFIIGIIFASVSSARDLLIEVTPWAAVILVCLVFVMLLVAASQQDIGKFFKPGFAWIPIGILAIVIVVAIFKVFHLKFDLDSFVANKTAGMAILIVLGVIVSFILTWKVKK